MAQPIGLKAVMDVKDFSKGQKQYESGLASMQGKTEKTTKGLSSLLKGAGAVALGVFGAKMVQGVVKGIGEMVSAAAEIPGVQSAFEGLGGSIEKMREGSLGMVTDIDLMKSFNSAAQLVSTDFAQKMPDAMGYLSKVSAATGQDMGFMIDSLVKGVGRLSPMILDNLGIQVNMTEAAEAWAKKQGGATGAVIDNTKAMSEQSFKIKEAQLRLTQMNEALAKGSKSWTENDVAMKRMAIEKQQAKIAELTGGLNSLAAANGTVSTDTKAMLENMTKAQQQEAIMDMVMEKLAKNTAAMPEIFGTTAQSMAAFKTTITNTKHEIGKGMLPVMNAVLKPTLQLAQKFLPMLGKASEAAGNAIATGITHGVDVAHGVIEKAKSLIAGFAEGKEWFGGAAGGVKRVASLLGIDPKHIPEIYDIASRVEEAIDKARYIIGSAIGHFQSGLLQGSAVKGVANVLQYALGLPPDLVKQGTDIAQTVQDTIDKVRSGFKMGQMGAAIGGTDMTVGGLSTVMRILGLPSDLVTAFSTAGNTIISTAQTTLDKIKTGFASGGVGGVFDALVPAGGDTATMLAPVLDPLKAIGTEAQRVITEGLAAFDAGGIKGLFDSVVGNAFDFLGVFTRSKNDLIGGLMTLGGSLLTTLGEAFPELQPIIDTFLKPALEIGKRVFDAINMAKGQIISAALGLFTTVATDAPAALASLPETINSILTTAIGLFETAFPVILDVVNAVIPVVLSVIETMAPVFATAFEVVGNIVADVMPTVSDIIGQVAGFIEERMPQIAATIQTALEIIQALWNAVWPVLQTVIEEVWPVIEAVIGGALDFLQGIFNTVLLLIKGDFIGAFDSLKETVTSLAETLLDVVIKAFEAVWNICEPLGEFIKNILAGAFEFLKLILDKLVDGELQKIRDAMDKVAVAVEKAKDWLDKAAGGFKGVMDAVNNLIGPIKNVIDWLGKIKVPEQLQSHSPSPFEVSLIGIGQALKSTGKMFAEFAMGMDATQAKNFKEVTKGVNELVGAFADLLDLMVKLNAQPTGMDMTGLSAFLGKFENSVYAVMGVVDRLLNSIGYKRLKLLDKAAKYFKQIFDNVLINFEDISTAAVPDMNVFKENVIAVGVAIVQALQGMVQVTGQNSLNQAARFAEIAEEVFAFVKSAIDVLKEMSEYDLTVSMEDKVANMLDRLWEIVPQFVLFAQKFAGTALETAASIYASMTGVVSFIKPALDAITELAKYVIVESVSTQVANMLGLLWEIVPELVLFAAKFEKDALEAADEVLTAAKGLISIIKSALDVIKALSEYVTVTTVKAAIQNVSDLLTEIVDVLADAADVTKTEGYFAAAEYYAAVKGMIEVVQTAIDVVKAVSEYEPLGSVQSGAENLLLRLTSIVYILANAADVTKTEGYKAASAYYDSTSGMLGIIKPAIDAIAAVLSYKPSGDVGMQTAIFAIQFAQFITLIKNAANIAATEAYQAASNFYTATRGIIDFIKPAIDAIAAVLSYKPSVDVGMQTAIFAIQFAQFITLMKNVANIAATEAYQAASNFYTATLGIVNFVKPASDALAAVLAYVGATNLAGKAKRFGIDALTMLLELKDATIGLSTEGYQAASDFFTATNGIIGFIQPAIDALTALGEYASVVGLRTKAEWFRVDVVFVMDKIKLMARQFIDDGLEEAKVFGAAVTRTADILSGAVGMLNTVLGYVSDTGLRGNMRRLVDGLTYILDQVRILAQDFDQDAVADAEELSAGVINLTGALDAAFAAFAETIGTLGDLPAAGQRGVQLAAVFDQQVTTIMRDLYSAMNSITLFMGGVARDGRSWGATFQQNVRNALESAISLLRSKYSAWSQYWGKYKDDIDALTEALKKMHEEAAKALVIGGGGGGDGGGGGGGDDGGNTRPPNDGGGGGPGLRGQNAFGWPSLVGAGVGGYNSSVNVTINMGGVTVSDQIDAARLADFIGQTVAQRLRR